MFIHTTARLHRGVISRGHQVRHGQAGLSNASQPVANNAQDQPYHLYARHAGVGCKVGKGAFHVLEGTTSKKHLRERCLTTCANTTNCAAAVILHSGRNQTDGSLPVIKRCELYRAVALDKCPADKQRDVFIHTSRAAAASTATRSSLAAHAGSVVVLGAEWDRLEKLNCFFENGGLMLGKLDGLTASGAIASTKARTVVTCMQLCLAHHNCTAVRVRNERPDGRIQLCALLKGIEPRKCDVGQFHVMYVRRRNATEPGAI